MQPNLIIAAGDPAGGAPRPWLFAGPTSDVLAEIGDAWHRLSPVERARAAAFRSPADRDDFIAAHALVRSCAARLLDVDPADVAIAQTCEACGGGHGRPFVVDRPHAHVSWSHARGYVAAGAALVGIGVDVEVVGRVRLDDRLLDMVLAGADLAAVRAASHPERTFSLQWARKECLVKLGLATLDTMRDVDLTDLPLDLDRLPRWQPWRDGMDVLSWWDDARQAVGAAVKLDLGTPDSAGATAAVDSS